MSPRRPPSSGVLPIVLLVGGLFVVLAGLGGGTLWALGTFTRAAARTAEPSHEGMVAIPVSVKPIPAYTLVTRDYLLDPKTAVLAVIYVHPETVRHNAKVLTTTDKIIGRVAARDKPAGYVFTEDDFLPPRTRPGTVAGVPPGKRAVVVAVDKIGGVQALKAGDHFDLLGCRPVEDRKTASGGLVVLPGAQAVPHKRGLVSVLAQDGVVVVPMTTRRVPVAGGRAGNQTKPVQEAVIAIAPREMAALAEALDLDTRVTCVLRSGRPDDPGEPIPPPTNTPQRVVVEEIKGTKRRLVEFPVPPPPPPAPAAAPKSAATAARPSPAHGEAKSGVR